MECNEKYASSEPAGDRKPYEQPAIDESADFETLALTCGKVSGVACEDAGGTTNS